MARIVAFAYDIAEAAQIRRIRSFRLVGHTVSSVSFRRRNMNAGFRPDWDDHTLGFVGNGQLGVRVLVLLHAALHLAVRPRLISGADVLVARNLDLLVLAWWTRLIHRQGRTRLVYECLDIHGVMTHPGLVGRVFRAIERFLLARTDLLIVSSPGFVANYFSPVQGYSGPLSLLENKLWFDDDPVPRPALPKAPDPDAPLVLGCVGSIRCPESLALLCGVADALSSDVRVVFHGNVHRHAVPDFDDVIAERSNMSYHGVYDYPQGLAEVYASCDIVWAQDLWQRGTNSDWLLPNRIYEASWFACPSIAVKDTETGRRIAASGLGVVIPEPTTKALVACLRELSSERIAKLSADVLARPDDDFRLTAAELNAALEPVLDGTRTPVGVSGPRSSGQLSADVTFK